uniref:AWS domain-containing protein n=1 Tax=Heliothis virescens TaxID=7102 RepID=A0A2A4J7R2_HELVI
MAKRKKAATKTAATRRTTRRAKQQAEAASSADGEASASVELEPTAPEAAQQDTETAPTDASAAPDPQASETSDKSENPLTKPCQVPIVALHKKFGKYRCLFNNDETFTKKYDIGSDSETNSSVEIRVVDPCASSESDSNAALDTQSDTNSPMNSTIIAQSNSRDISPVPALSEPSSQCEMPSTIPIEKEEVNEKPEELNTIDLTESDSKLSGIEQVADDKDDCQIIDDPPIPEAKPEEIPAEDIPMEGEQIEFTGDDDEVITIVQIVEDDHPELYYNIKIDSPNEHVSENIENEEAKENCDNSEFQINFEKLNLASASESDPPMDCSEGVELSTSPCLTPDIQFKENLNDGLTRPDPSLTPSSTLSDDSNSSRVTEQNQNNSNDSAESSPTGVRRSSRIKTISNMKQKTKGYGLVKTPLKKALITQAKMKLEEIGSDSQEKTSESLPNTQPNSPSFPVPSEMPVKVKSRWRRSSELEMGASSPANSPLASPSLPQQRLPPVAESPSLPEEEPSAPPLSKEDYDRIIEERMNQYQHLDENEYLCERMISKETKKMTCDCFMTKEELERGELACGEDCLNRLLMIECNSRCPVGDRCTNRRFQSKENAPLKVFYADKKGCGVEAIVDIPTCAERSSDPNINPEPRRGRSSQAESRGNSLQVDLKEEMRLFKADITQMLDKISNDVTEVKSQNMSIQKKFAELQSSNDDVIKSIQFISSQYEEMRLKIETIEKTKKEQYDRIKILEDKIEELDRATCLSKLEIRNLPQKERETRNDLMKAVLNITETVNSNLEQNQVKDIYRITNKTKQNSVVVVDVSTPMTKSNIIKAVKDYNLKHKPKSLNASCIDDKYEPKPLFVSEHLTFKTKKLYYLTREFAKSEKYAFAWTANGKIYLRKKEGDPHIIIKSENQLESLKNNK